MRLTEQKTGTIEGRVDAFQSLRSIVFKIIKRGQYLWSARTANANLFRKLCRRYLLALNVTPPRTLKLNR